MKTLATWKILTLALGFLMATDSGCKARDKDFDSVDGPNVRVLRHDDGSRTLFTRSPDNRKLTAKKFSSGGVLSLMTVYTNDANGNPIGCKISDGQGNLLYKVSYGYRKSDGQLVEERMFDARVVRKDPNTNKEMPVRVVKYVYDAQGNRSKPMVFTLIPGKMFEDVFGNPSTPSTLPEKNPFKETPAGKQANPNARPVGR